jgi:prepilin-type N-terminal cleavage/methylation domain-containing protein/prepilin-type processing-associated H-X9-DG protein
VRQLTPGAGTLCRGPHGSRRGAFTLVELLVVLAIMSVLTGILLPALARARAQALRQTCTSNLRQLGMALALYTQDYDERLPSFRAEPASAAHADQLDYWHDHFCAGLNLFPGERCWADLAAPYTRSDRVFFCPADGRPRERPVTSYEFKPGLAQAPALAAIERPASVATLYEQWSYHLERQSEYSGSAAGNILFVDGHVAWRRFVESTSARYHSGVNLHWLHAHNTPEHPCDGRDFVP